MEIPIKIDAQTIAKIRDIRLTKLIPNQYLLRLGMKGSGCSGTFYAGFDTLRPQDLVFELEDQKVIINKTKLLYFFQKHLTWTEADTENGLQQGFMFSETSIK